MYMKKLIGGVSAFAMISAGTASALTFSLPTTTINLAEEVDFDAGVVGPLGQMEIRTNTNLPPQSGYKLTINLTGGAVFDGFTAANVTAPASTFANPIISTGGNDGDSQVVILFDVTGPSNVGFNLPILLDLPVSIANCASDVSANIVLTNSVNSVIEGGNATLKDGIGVKAVAVDALTCVDAFQVVIAPDANNTLLSLSSGFKNFLVAGGDTKTLATIGEVEVTVDNTAVGGDLATPVSQANIASLSYDVEFASTTGISQVDHAGGVVFPIKTAVKTGTTYAVETVGATGTGTDSITLTLTGAAVVSPQTLKVANTVVDLTAGFVDEAATVTGNGVDDLQLEGANFGPFDWVGDTSTIATTVFRVTGLKTKPSAVVTVTNSSGTKDGTYTLDLSGKTLSGAATTGSSQLVLTNADIQAAVGGPFGIGDITLTFFTSDAVDVDRLIATGGIVSAFGDSGNSDNSALGND